MDNTNFENTKPTILVVDDEQDIRKLVKFNLKRLGYKVLTADSGEEAIKIPAGSQPGKTIRIKGKGVPRLRRNGRGDQIVILSVDIPRSLTSEQRDLFKQLAETMGTEVRPQETTLMDRIRDLLGGL